MQRERPQFSNLDLSSKWTTATQSAAIQAPISVTFLLATRDMSRSSIISAPHSRRRQAAFSSSHVSPCSTVTSCINVSTSLQGRIPNPHFNTKTKRFFDRISKIKNKAGYTATSCGRVGRGGNTHFHTFRLVFTDQPTDRPTDGRTDRRTDERTDGPARNATNHLTNP